MLGHPADDVALDTLGHIRREFGGRGASQQHLGLLCLAHAHRQAHDGGRDRVGNRDASGAGDGRAALNAAASSLLVGQQ